MQLYSGSYLKYASAVDPYLRVVFVKIMCKSIIPFSRASFLQYFIIAERHPTFSGLYITKTGFPSILRYLLSLKFQKVFKVISPIILISILLALLNNYFSSPDYFPPHTRHFQDQNSKQIHDSFAHDKQNSIFISALSKNFSIGFSNIFLPLNQYDKNRMHQLHFFAIFACQFITLLFVKQ